MFKDIQFNDYVDVHSNRGEFCFTKVFFISQDQESIEILDYVHDKNVRIPKAAIEEIANHSLEERVALEKLKRKLSAQHFEQLTKTHERRLATMGPASKYLYAYKYITKVQPGEDGSLRVYFADGNWWHYDINNKWY